MRKCIEETTVQTREFAKDGKNILIISTEAIKRSLLRRNTFRMTILMIKEITKLFYDRDFVKVSSGLEFCLPNRRSRR